MTPKQTERIQFKIKKIKKELAADKKRWGGFYDDSRGLRYLPPELYLKIHDYSGALRYFNWFSRTFPEDSGYPVFLFEWAIALYKKGKIKNAESKITETHRANSYIVPAFLGIATDVQVTHHSNWKTAGIAQDLAYSKEDAQLADFAEWLAGHLQKNPYQPSSVNHK
ncbi:hypothetical protein EGI11_02430 [Chryseobacterium sp. H3056]|uniref:Uncharacterized protein n=1 Tax=Kaistella daneshvariae TaxID=2487074 RepID=A0A3N0X056_9FLAO|nr:hypothetical protein [Kaistella daneshvariae]ROI10768.1 hypothetical protein EGI11_02430 [Kaistella daneshvariae]